MVPSSVRHRIRPGVRSLPQPDGLPRHRLMTAPLRVLPDFLVIGAAKAGTSSLFYALKNHPAVFPPMTKELGFFDTHWHHGVGWYRAHFPTTRERARALAPGGPGFSTFEATPYYLF